MDEDIACMMENLSNHIGEEISVDSWVYGRKVVCKGTLKEVYPFAGIETEHMYAPFIGYGDAIKTIRLSETDEVIYYNPNIEDNYDRRDFESIAHSLIRSFGINYK